MQPSNQLLSHRDWTINDNKHVRAPVLDGSNSTTMFAQNRFRPCEISTKVLNQATCPRTALLPNKTATDLDCSKSSKILRVVIGFSYERNGVHRVPAWSVINDTDSDEYAGLCSARTRPQRSRSRGHETASGPSRSSRRCRSQERLCCLDRAHRSR